MAVRLARCACLNLVSARHCSPLSLVFARAQGGADARVSSGARTRRREWRFCQPVRVFLHLLV